MTVSKSSKLVCSLLILMLAIYDIQITVLIIAIVYFPRMFSSIIQQKHYCTIRIPERLTQGSLICVSVRAPLAGATFLAPIFCRHISGINFFVNLYYFTIILLCQILILLKMSLFDKIKNTKRLLGNPIHQQRKH